MPDFDPWRSLAVAAGITAAARLDGPALARLQRERLAALLDAWESDTRRSFLDSYFRNSDQDAEDFRRLIELAELEKVLYELRYELANRPDWVRIPLEGLNGLLNA